jgi:hypothetical protein
MYIRLDAIQPQLVVQLREAAKKGNWTGNAVISKDGEIIDWRMKAGLKPSPITRDLKWGVPVPTPEGEDDGMDGKVFYVWVRTTLCMFFSKGIDSPLSVRCANRISKHYCQLYPGMETVVVEPSECEAVSVHGQRQCLLPYGVVASLLTRGRTSVDPIVLYIRDW